MCEPVPTDAVRMSRRRFLVVAPASVAVAGLAGAPVAVHAAPSLSIVPRSEWGPGLAPTGPVPDEPDVRFLLVHHSVNGNTYEASAVPGMLTGIFQFHTGTKGWPDIAYNFFVDRFGGVWEGRSGSLAAAKAVDATGGSQGFAQLCCFLGDHSSAPPSEAAVAAMGSLLGWLAARNGVDLADGARASFTSRGSNRYPAGSAVDVSTVAGHRDVSQTACPGDAAYALVADGTFRRLARGDAGLPSTTSPTTTTVSPSTTSAPAPTTSTTVAPTTSTTRSSTTTTTTTSITREVALSPERPRGTGSSGWGPAAAGAGVLAVVAAGVVGLRARLQGREPPR